MAIGPYFSSFPKKLIWDMQHAVSDGGCRLAAAGEAFAATRVMAAAERASTPWELHDATAECLALLREHSPGSDLIPRLERILDHYAGASALNQCL